MAIRIGLIEQTRQKPIVELVDVYKEYSVWNISTVALKEG